MERRFTCQAFYRPASGECGPRSASTASCATKSTLIPGTTWSPPNPTWLVSWPNQNLPVDPHIQPPSEDEWVAGLQYEFLPNTRASFSYTHRSVVRWVEDMGVNGSDYFIGNPGYGIGAMYPPAQRVYDSFVVAVDKVYSDLWLGQISYTYQKLTGNLEGLYRNETEQVLSDAAHRGSQFQALAVVDYGLPECAGLQYVAQAVFPITPCLDDSICLPDPVPDQVPFPYGRGLGSQLARDYRAFWNLDPALLGNPEIASILGEFGAGPGATDDDGNLHDVGVCFYSEPFPSLCLDGSTLSTTGACVVGPGSNPH